MHLLVAEHRDSQIVLRQTRFLVLRPVAQHLIAPLERLHLNGEELLQVVDALEKERVVDVTMLGLHAVEALKGQLEQHGGLVTEDLDAHVTLHGRTVPVVERRAVVIVQQLSLDDVNDAEVGALHQLEEGLVVEAWHRVAARALLDEEDVVNFVSFEENRLLGPVDIRVQLRAEPCDESGTLVL